MVFSLLLNLAGGIAVATGVTVKFVADAPIPDRLDQVSVVELEDVPTFIWQSPNCRYRGLIVPFERLWQQKTSNPFVEEFRPPEPGKIAGHAIVINKRLCRDSAPERVDLVQTQYTPVIHSNDYYPKGSPRLLSSLSGMPESSRPEWVSQITTKLIQQADSNDAVKAFVQFEN